MLYGQTTKFWVIKYNARIPEYPVLSEYVKNVVGHSKHPFVYIMLYLFYLPIQVSYMTI